MLTAAELKQHVAVKGLTATSTEDSDSASLETDDDSRTSADDDIESGRYGTTAAAPRRQQLGRTHPPNCASDPANFAHNLRGSVQVQRQAALGQDCSVAVLPDKGSRARLCPHGQVCAGVC